MKILLVLVLAACSTTAFAGLGGAPSLPAPRILSGSATPASPGAAPYTELTKTLDSGTEVHEYVNAAGTVFAVSWSGPYLPDLSEVLGAHFQALVDLQQQRGRSRSPVSLRQADLVIFSGGRMGAFEGRAWIPSLLPPGFNSADIGAGRTQ